MNTMVLTLAFTLALLGSAAAQMTTLDCSNATNADRVTHKVSAVKTAVPEAHRTR